MIIFEDVSFDFGGGSETKEPFFSNLNLHIQSGEYLAVIGPNGSGKTTLVMIAKGLLIPLRGKILYKGENLIAGGINHRIGYIFSNPENQIVSSIVEEDVAFGPENQGRESSDIAAAVRKALDLGKIRHIASGLTHLLSGGEQQKVIIAGILAMNVECIVFDEAASMLDPAGKREILELLQKLNKTEGITIIHITHDVGDILAVDRVLAMRFGKIIFDGALDVLIHDDALLKLLGIKAAGKMDLVGKLLKNGIICRDDLGGLDSIAEAICRGKTKAV